MNETLRPKQEAFCQNYCSIGSDTFYHGGNSAIAAGYSEKGAYVRASELLRKRNIIDRINEINEENLKKNGVTIHSVLVNLAHDRLMARKHHQYAVAKGITELEGKFLAMWTNKIETTNAPKEKQFSEQEWEEQKKREAEIRKLKEEAGDAICMN